MIICMHVDTEIWVVYIWILKVRTLKRFYFTEKFLVQIDSYLKLTKILKKSALLDLISRQNNSNKDLTKKLDKDKSCLKNSEHNILRIFCLGNQT